MAGHLPSQQARLQPSWGGLPPQHASSSWQVALRGARHSGGAHHRQERGLSRRFQCAHRHRQRASAAAGKQAKGFPAPVDFEEQYGSDYAKLSERVQELAAEVVEGLGGTSVYLVGMMGSGKTTVGRLLGSALKYPLFDTDELVERAAGCTIADIFAQDGEEAMRDVESQVLHELMPFKKLVVSTGGGAVLRRQNWGYMQHGVVIWLEGAPELLAARALKDGTATRPLLQGSAGEGQGAGEGGDEYAQTVKRLRGLLKQRREHYAQADLHVPLRGVGEAAAATGAPAALVTYRPALVSFELLNSLNERLKKDGVQRDKLAQAGVDAAPEGKPAAAEAAAADAPSTAVAASQTPEE